MQLALDTVERTAAPPLAPAGQTIDREHLARMTLGDRSLETEVLELFDRQAGMLLTRMKDAGANVVAALAHTLKGSARGIGAWQVAQAAEAVELAAPRPDQDVLAAAVERLAAAVDEARAAIATLLPVH
jgi:HPt (histidine-containing phosphotransfer) domain-containing protein